MDELTQERQMAMANALRKSPVSANLMAAPLMGQSVGHGFGGRLAYAHDIDADRSIEAGISGGYADGRAGGYKINQGTLGGANLTYRNKDQTIGLNYDNDVTQDGRPNKRVMLNFIKQF